MKEKPGGTRRPKTGKKGKEWGPGTTKKKKNTRSDKKTNDKDQGDINIQKQDKPPQHDTNQSTTVRNERHN